MPPCRRCGKQLQEVFPLGRAPRLALLGASAAVLLAATPDLLHALAGLAVRHPIAPALIARIEPAPDPRYRPMALLDRGLLAKLREGDARWIPRVENLPDGGTRYHYRRRPGDPPLTLEQIRTLIAMPPSYDAERESVVSLLRTLQAAGVQIQLIKPRKPGAAAEWDASARTMRINPSVVANGSLDFARVLNHEALHVAQSCKAGGLRSAPRKLGLPVKDSPHLQEQLRSTVYSEASDLERSLEAEAYAHQNQLGLGEELLARHCTLRS